MTLPFVIWDLDGTLVDSGTDIAMAANSALSDLGRPTLPMPIIQSFVGEGAARLMDRAVGEAEPIELRRTALDRFLVRYEEKLRVHTVAYPGVDALVRRLEGNQAIATNKPAALARQLVDLMGWRGLFRVIVGGGEVARRKPAPDAIFRVLELAGECVENAVFVGDTPIDIQTAQAAHIRFICVSWGLRPRSELSAAPVIVDSVSELEQSLRRD